MARYETIQKGIAYFREGKVRCTHRSKHFEFYTVQGQTEDHFVTVDHRKDMLLCTCKHGSLQGAAHGEICSHKIATILAIEKDTPIVPE